MTSKMRRPGRGIPAGPSQGGQRFIKATADTKVVKAVQAAFHKTVGKALGKDIEAPERRLGLVPGTPEYEARLEELAKDPPTETMEYLDGATGHVRDPVDAGTTSPRLNDGEELKHWFAEHDALEVEVHN